MDRLSLILWLLVFIPVLGKGQQSAPSESGSRDTLLQKEISRIDSEIIAFPNRLDRWIDKIKLLGESGQYEAYTATILALMDQNEQNKSVWQWKNNAKLTNTPDFLLQYVDNFTVQLYNLEDESLHPYMDRIANRVLDSYPNHVPSLSNLAITALYRKDYETGISYLTKARSIAPTNTSVLGNLAYAYEQIGDPASAIECYETMVAHGDAQTQDYAKKQLEKLKK